jgi:two-component system NtrC family sensor kinase
MKRARRSLRSIITLSFLAFTIIPLAFISGYSTVLYEASINNELQKRLEGNIREVGVNLAELERVLIINGRIHASDPTLSYHVATRNVPASRRIITDWLKTYVASRIALFDRDGRLMLSELKDANNSVKEQSNLEHGDIFLTDSLVKLLVEKNQTTVREVQAGHGLDLIVYTRILNKGITAGFMEEVIQLGDSFMQSLKKRMNLEAVIFDDKYLPAASSSQDFFLYPKDFFPSKLASGDPNPPHVFLEIASRGEPYGMLIRKVIDTQGKPYITLGLAASKTDTQKVLHRIKTALLTVTLLVLLLMLPALLLVTNRVVKPINLLVDATQKLESGAAGYKLNHQSDTEIGLLIDSFNRMSRSISLTQKLLEKKVEEVEKTNAELTNTQTTLVHSAKMASLGQLVAGVAHELNNPIGFIYSNMSPLRDYVEKLQRVLKTAETDPKNLEKVKKEVEFDYVMDDLPKLISSCEDGARRTRDIVVGLRNFSRLDEASLKRVDIHEGISNTLSLLSSELKNRITIHKDFGKISEVRCFVSQLNQVFMNIISNASQAISKRGEILIKTWQEGSQVFISIKDSGPGIAKSDLDKIFDPFFTTKPVGSGTGLGLSITYGIIQKHDGVITVKSEKGNGTEFLIALPVDGPSDEKVSS